MLFCRMLHLAFSHNYCFALLEFVVRSGVYACVESFVHFLLQWVISLYLLSITYGTLNAPVYRLKFTMCMYILNLPPELS